MTALSSGDIVLLVAAGLGAGTVNGVAGGGTLVSFPALLATGLQPLQANVTSTLGIWPGYLGGVAGFRSEVREQPRRRLVVLSM
ncbi:MAG: TSUP family transporter, partial [Acidimicrobiales bacterium]